MLKHNFIHQLHAFLEFSAIFSIMKLLISPFLMHNTFNHSNRIRVNWNQNFYNINENIYNNPFIRLIYNKNLNHYFAQTQTVHNYLQKTQGKKHFPLELSIGQGVVRPSVRPKPGSRTKIRTYFCCPKLRTLSDKIRTDGHGKIRAN